MGKLTTMQPSCHISAPRLPARAPLATSSSIQCTHRKHIAAHHSCSQSVIPTSRAAAARQPRCGATACCVTPLPPASPHWVSAPGPPSAAHLGQTNTGECFAFGGTCRVSCCSCMAVSDCERAVDVRADIDARMQELKQAEEATQWHPRAAS